LGGSRVAVEIQYRMKAGDWPVGSSLFAWIIYPTRSHCSHMSFKCRYYLFTPGEWSTHGQRPTPTLQPWTTVPTIHVRTPCVCLCSTHLGGRCRYYRVALLPCFPNVEDEVLPFFNLRNKLFGVGKFDILLIWVSCLVGEQAFRKPVFWSVFVFRLCQVSLLILYLDCARLMRTDRPDTSVSGALWEYICLFFVA